jgi:hypothetical protein
MKPDRAKVRTLRRPASDPASVGRRHQVRWNAFLTTGRTGIECQVINISVGGATLRLAGASAPQAKLLWLMTDYLGPIPGKQLWSENGLIGIGFVPDAPIINRLRALLQTIDPAVPAFRTAVTPVTAHPSAWTAPQSDPPAPLSE